MIVERIADPDGDRLRCGEVEIAWGDSIEPGATVYEIFVGLLDAPDPPTSIALLDEEFEALCRLVNAVRAIQHGSTTPIKL